MSLIVHNQQHPFAIPLPFCCLRNQRFQMIGWLKVGLPRFR